MLSVSAPAPVRAEGPTPSRPEKAAPRRIDINVTTKGFEPRSIKVKKGEDILLVFTRVTDDTCAKEVIVYLENDRKIRRALPLRKPLT